jgi:RNA polymerase sigma-70 factor (ECF subfamily)
MPSDTNILEEIRRGNARSFERLFRQCYAPLVRYSTRIAGSKEAGEEIVQDLFYTIWKDRESLPDIHSLNSYLYAGIRNRSIQYCEHEAIVRHHREVALAGIYPDAPSPQEEMEYAEFGAMITRTLESLPERRRKIFGMHRIEGLKYSEIAAALSLSVKTIEAEMTKAISTLRKAIAKYNQG